MKNYFKVGQHNIGYVGEDNKIMKKKTKTIKKKSIKAWLLMGSGIIDTKICLTKKDAINRKRIWKEEWDEELKIVRVKITFK